MPILRKIFKSFEANWPNMLSDTRLMPTVFKLAQKVANQCDPYVDSITQTATEKVIWCTATIFSRIRVKSIKIEECATASVKEDVAVLQEEVVGSPHHCDENLVPTYVAELGGGPNLKRKGNGKGAAKGGNGKGKKSKGSNMVWVRVN
eukprot:GEMP01120498.1.p1 GENE.GEMP01120498.1~~GEMP01120498.1.p1  ORF type:complete len:148 (+),score=39.38 GEMP01120498.1:62-505(+)